MGTHPYSGHTPFLFGSFGNVHVAAGGRFSFSYRFSLSLCRTGSMAARSTDVNVRKIMEGNVEDATSAGQLDAESAMAQLSQEMMEGEESESVEERIERALRCPCVAELRDGPCGGAFKGAFSCFMRSEAEEKGSDCVEQFIALQSCVVDHPDEFSEDLRQSVEEEKGEEEKKTT